MRLRESNLHDTSPAPADRPPPSGSRHLTTRTVDGTFNDLENPTMGSAGTRFGRNVPVELTFPENEWALLRPNPRTVSRELLMRHEFQPATTLNLLAAAWLQFMIRDWFSHGKSEKENPWELELEEDDPWTQERPMKVVRTPRDLTRQPDDTLINAALLAKIYTVEWTTAILGHPTLQIGMRANWWGVAGERIHKLLGRISPSEVLSGIPGS